MKTLILFAALFSQVTYGHEIEGTRILNGSLKTKIRIDRVNTTCRLKVEKVRNLMKEDSYGNPAYRVDIKLTLDGFDSKSEKTIKMNRDVRVINLHEVGDKLKVSDVDYFNKDEDVKVKIDENGRLVSTSFKFQNRPITCEF
jgi:hypothetical protein